jgi:cell division initiation protein
MRYTPVELRHVRIGRAFFGYRRDDTDRMLEDVADSFEDVWSERGELTDKLEDVEKQLEDFKQREVLLANTLISAEKAAAEAKELARREAEVILAEAHQEARSITRAAQSERERLFAEARRVATLLRAALGLSEEAAPERQEADSDREDGPDPPVDHWPKREDTREFQAVPLPPPLPESAEGDDEDEPAAPPLPPAAEEDVAAAELDAQPDHDDESAWAGRDFAWG